MGLRSSRFILIDVSEIDFTVLIFIVPKSVGSRVFIFFVEVNVAVKLLQQGSALGLFHSDTQIIAGEKFRPSFWEAAGSTVSFDEIAPLLNGLICRSLKLLCSRAPI